MTEGYIKLWRALQDSPLWNGKNEPFSKGQAWVDLLMLANYRDRTILFRGIPVLVKRGALARSEVYLSTRWNWSRNRVRRFLRVLESEQQVAQQTTNVTSIITILNYERYQGSDTANDTASDTASDTADGTASDTTKEEEKKKRRKEDTPKAPKGARTMVTDSEAVAMIPGPLRCECFQSALTGWLQYKRERKEKIIPTGLKQLLSRLANMGSARATAAIEYSMAQQWQGIFEEKQNGQQKSPDSGYNEPFRLAIDPNTGKRIPLK